MFRFTIASSCYKMTGLVFIIELFVSCGEYIGLWIGGELGTANQQFIVHGICIYSSDLLLLVAVILKMTGVHH